jgi:hypothetical protein
MDSAVGDDSRRGVAAHGEGAVAARSACLAQPAPRLTRPRSRYARHGTARGIARNSYTSIGTDVVRRARKTRLRRSEASLKWRTQQVNGAPSTMEYRLRKPLLYPLSYEGGTPQGTCQREQVAAGFRRVSQAAASWVSGRPGSTRGVSMYFR